MDRFVKEVLVKVAQSHGTPSFVYFSDHIGQKIAQLKRLLGEQTQLSYAVKSNPNIGLLSYLQNYLVSLDVSSIGEFQRGLIAGFKPEQIGFSGPAKRLFEIESAVRDRIGEIICESPQQINQVDKAARKFDSIQDILIRINPKKLPKAFGLHMGGRPSQFGVDEEDLDQAYGALQEAENVRLTGFHIFSGGNSLNVNAIVENFEIMSDVFRHASKQFDIAPGRLVFGSGFGIPYFENDEELDLVRLAQGINTVIEALKVERRFSRTKFVVEMGRFMVGGAGYMLTSVVDVKHSRGTDIVLCDAGFNNNLSAAGMMGTVIRRDWQLVNISNDQNHDHEYLVVGPLCASFDILAAKIRLSDTRVGDVLAVPSSGAYGLTASPTRFISHPEPQEFLVEDTEMGLIVNNVTESGANHLDKRFHLPDQPYGKTHA